MREAEKIVLPPDQTDFLRKALVSALQEAPASVKELIKKDSPSAPAKEKKGANHGSGLVF